MPVLSCQHCGSVYIIVGADSDTDVCTQIHCRANNMVRHEDERDAHNAIRKATYSVDLAAEKQAAEASFRNALHKAATVTAEKP